MSLQLRTEASSDAATGANATPGISRVATVETIWAASVGRWRAGSWLAAFERTSPQFSAKTMLYTALDPVSPILDVAGLPSFPQLHTPLTRRRHGPLALGTMSPDQYDARLI
jgi:hypothetical protein